MVLLLLVAVDARAMGASRVRGSLLAAGWATAGLITLVSAFLIWQQVASVMALTAASIDGQEGAPAILRRGLPGQLRADHADVRIMRVPA